MTPLNVANAFDAPAAHVSTTTNNRYRAYVLVLIWLVMLLRTVDIQVIALLLEDIRKEFSISDTQLGLLTGFAFSVFYGVFGVPTGWLADRWNRRNIISIALTLWSGMTALCGVATSFGGLLIARIGVGVGEAGGTAPSYSLISDYFSVRRRATVFAILNSSVPAGIFAGLLIGGLLSPHYGWRAAFMAVGVPGVIVALLARFTLREPPRTASAVASVPFKSAVKYLLARRSYRHFVLGSSLFTLGAVGTGVWMPTFFVRVHGMSTGDAGLTLAFIYGSCGMSGVLLGGYIADRTAGRTGDRRWYAWLPAVTTVAILPLTFFLYLLPGTTPALITLAMVAILMHAWMGPLYGTIQGLAGPSRRATAAAINMLAINLIAYGMGPLLVGIASDYTKLWFGGDSLRYSMLCVVFVSYAWAAMHFYLAARTIRQDLTLADSPMMPFPTAEASAR